MLRLVFALLILSGCAAGAETEDAQRAKADARKAANQAWNEKILLGGYDNVGHKDPKWDENARAALQQVVNWAAQDPRYSFNEEILLDYCDKAIAAGCDDPAILFYRADMLHVFKREMPSADATATVIDAVAASGYSPRLKFIALVRGADWALATKDQDSREKAGALLDRAIALIPDFAHDPEMPADPFLGVCIGWVKSASSLGKVRREALERMSVVLIKEFPGRTLPFLLKAWFFLNETYRAEGSADKEEWVVKADKELNEALKIDPADPTALAEMIVVCAWRHQSRATMEQWFKRAMDANPDNNRACISKTFYLDPALCGSKEAMVAFGRECVKSGNWIGRIPFTLIDVHVELARKGDETVYYKNTEVWKDIESVYEEWLKRFPDSAYERTFYARLATLAGQWDIAEREFKLLGEHPLLRVFKDRDEYDRLRKLSAEHAGKEK